MSPPPDILKPVFTTSQRFPHPRGSHLDADKRRAVASKGFGPSRTRSYPTGGLHITSGEWKVLIIVFLVSFAIRLFRISKLNSTVSVNIVWVSTVFRKILSYLQVEAFWKIHFQVHQDTNFFDVLAKLLMYARRVCFWLWWSFWIQGYRKVSYIKYLSLKIRLKLGL